MTQADPKRVAVAVERLCGESLRTIEGTAFDSRRTTWIAIPRKAVVFMATMAALRRLDLFTPQLKKTFLERAENARRRAGIIEAEATLCRTFKGVSENLRVQAKWLRINADNLGRYARGHGRVDHDQAIPIIVAAILMYRVGFKHWRELANVLSAAYDAAGRDEKPPTADELRRAARQYRREQRP